MKYRIITCSLLLASASSIASGPQEAIAWANKNAALEPSSNHFFNAGMIFDWEPHRLYQVYTKPERITDITFETGETLLSIGGGDSQRWTISETQSGKDSSIKKHLFVKPHQMGISTNLVVTTDKRTYHIELHCLDNIPYQAAVSWRYPASNIILGNGFLGTDSKQLTPMSGLGHKQLDFNYHFVASEHPSWMPRRVFDDGHKTYIEFPEGMQDTEAPVLYGLSRAKEQEILNYRRFKNFYIIDHLIEIAELTVGGKTKIIIGIEKERQ